MSRWAVYSMDQAGNRTLVTDTGVNISYTPNVLNQYTGTVGGAAITNGSEHEIKTFQGNTYTYINDEHLKQVTNGSTNYYLYYDALGRCVKRILNGTTTYYIYDGEKPILEYKSSDLTHPAKNLYGKGIDEILMRTDPTVNSGQPFYYQQDHEGSVTHLVNAAGTVIESYRYDAFGAPTMYNGAGVQIASTAYNNRFLFTGREYAATYQKNYVPAFTFYEYRARAYHPGLGRFMSEDPKGFAAGDYNLFRYCHNDPVDMTDPMGLAGEATGLLHSGTNDRVWDPPSATEALWERQMNMSSSFGATSYGMRAYAAEQAFKISVGIEATKRAEAATGKSQIPYSVATMRYENTHGVAYGDPVPGARDTHGGYTEVIDTHHERFADFRANPGLWNEGKGWSIFVIGHTHPLSRSQDPGFSLRDRAMQAGQLSRYGQAIPLFKNNPSWPGHAYDARMMGPSGWEVTHYSESGKLLGGPESD